MRLSERKLRQLQPELFGWRSLFVRFPGKLLNARQTREMIAEHMSTGDSRAAVVVKDAPLLVAAYTDELDCVAILGFPDWLTREYGLRPGSTLLTVNTYTRGRTIARDLVAGPAALGRYSNFYPIIAEFVSDDVELINRRKEEIGKDEFQRTAALGQRRCQTIGLRVRDGRPLRSILSGEPARI